ncbi:hypothetical protein MMC16_007792, partial [Acarospora aff. strigata]|nr:hypothetical protein [Acarospora aff. strigata]
SSACSSTPTSTTSTAAAAATAAATATGTLLKNYTVADPKQVAEVALDCPHRNGEKYPTVRGQVYTITCWQGYGDYDLASITAYTLDACIEACSSMNYFQYPRNGNSTLCTAVAFGTNMSDNLRQYANCFLKNGTSRVTENIAGSATANLNAAGGQ